MTVAAVRFAYGLLWLITGLASAVAALTGIALRSVGTPHDALPATVATAVDLMEVNVPVTLMPGALVVLRWHEIPIAREAGDFVVAGSVVLNGLLVGGAIGQRPELWRFLPHLPFEWLALALPAAAWTLARRDALTSRRLRGLTASTVAALLVASCLETWAVPL